MQSSNGWIVLLSGSGEIVSNDRSVYCNIGLQLGWSSLNYPASRVIDLSKTYLTNRYVYCDIDVQLIVRTELNDCL